MFDGLFGLFNSSLPDGWGCLLLDRKLRKTGRAYTEITPLDRLSLIGTDLKPETSFWKAVKEQLNEE